MVEKNQPLSAFWPQFLEPFRTMGTRLSEWFAPASEASSAENEYLISMELPGVAEDDIQVTAAGGVLTIKGEKKTEREEKGDTWYFSERQYGAFSRSFRLPEDADPDGVKAVLKDGVLSVRVPRREPKKPESNRIPVSRG